MKMLLNLLLVFSLVPCLKGSFIPTGIVILDVTLKSFDIITFGRDIITAVINDEAIEDVQKSITELKASIDNVHDKLDYATAILERLTYNILLSQHIEQIKSCKEDFYNFLNFPKSTSARTNLLQCYSSMKNVRSLGGYLSGDVVTSSPSYFSLLKDSDGYYEGDLIKNMYTYLATHFIDGCIVVTAAERLKSEDSIFILECQKMINDINEYMKRFYRECIVNTCPVFLHRAAELMIKQRDHGIPGMFHALDNAFPWFQFLLIQLDAQSTNVSDINSPMVKSHMITINQKRIVLYWTNAFVKFHKEPYGNKRIVIEVERNNTIHDLNHIGSMNISRTDAGDITVFSGFTFDNSLDDCYYAPYISAAPGFNPQKQLLFITALLYFVVTLCC